MSDLDDSDAEAQAMAAAMGFSSFGAAPTRKKRKFNPATDSFVDGEQLEKLDRGGKKGKGSGGNNIPLGKQRVIGQKREVERKTQNEDEIELDLDDEDDQEVNPEGADVTNGAESQDPRLKIRRSVSPRQDEEEDEDGPRYMDTSEAAPLQSSHDTPAYLDTSLPPPLTAATLPYIHPQNAAALDAQAQINSILATTQTPPGSAATFYPPPGSTSHPSHYYQTFISDRILARDAPSANFTSGGGRGSPGRGRGRDQWSDTASVASHSTHGGRGRGEHNPRWYIDYYDLSFNENPWAKLELAMGLQSVGTWVERPERAGV